MLLLGDVAKTRTLRRLVFRDTFMVFVDFRYLRKFSRLYLDRMFEKNMRISIKNLNYRKRNSSRMVNIHL